MGSSSKQRFLNSYEGTPFCLTYLWREEKQAILSINYTGKEKYSKCAIFLRSSLPWKTLNSLRIVSWRTL